MMHYAGLPSSFWAEAVFTATYTRNRVSTKAVPDKVPAEIFLAQRQTVARFRVFGCDAWMHIPSVKRTKLEAKSQRMIFVGYDRLRKAYRLVKPGTSEVSFSRDVKFNENSFSGRIHHGTCSNGRDNGSLDVEFFGSNDARGVEYEHVALDESGTIPDEDESNEKDTGDETSGSSTGTTTADVSTSSDDLDQPQPVLRRSAREPKPKQFPDYLVGDDYEDFFEALDRQHAASATEEKVGEVGLEPKTVDQALNGPDSAKWKDAMQKEYDSLLKNGVFSLVPSPKDRNIVDNKWVFKIKRNADGSVERFKARLVARGFSQQPGVDYTETFSPVTRFSSVRTVLAIANQLDMDIHQMDVETAFLNGDLDEEIFMKQPTGFVMKGKENFVCKLHKGLYGLKQAARCWYQMLNDYVQKSGFIQCPSDPCLYYKKFGRDLVLLAVYVDDLLIAASNIKLLTHIKQNFSKRFRMRDMGELHLILGMKVSRDRKSKKLMLSQERFLQNLLKDHRMDSCNPVSTPLEPGLQLVKHEGDPVKLKEFQGLVGSLTFLASATRPDISAALGVLSQFASNPGNLHWQAAKRILRYLKGSLDMGVIFRGNLSSEVNLVGFVDADWAGDVDSRKSRGGYLFLLCGGPVSWVSRKQAVVALSSTEAEYVAAATAAQELLWLRNLLSELGFSQNKATVLHEDNMGAVEVSRNPRFHGRMKHIDIRHHFLRDEVEKGSVLLRFIQSKSQLADIFTKALPRDRFQDLRFKIGVSRNSAEESSEAPASGSLGESNS